MSLELRMAWRNVWRNPRRTSLTISATVFAVFLVIMAVAMAAGSHEKMIEDSVRVNAGHVQISGEGYLEKHTLEQSLPWDGRIEALLQAVPGVAAYAPRVVSFGLLSHESATRGAAVIGVDPEREGEVTTLLSRVQEGSFLSPTGQHEIVLGGRLAEILSVRIGDEVLLYSIAYSLETAYDLFTVVGIMRLPESEMDRTLSLISLRDAQSFFVYEDKISEVAVTVSDSDTVEPVVTALEGTFVGEEVEVHAWWETMPELQQLIVLDDAGMYIVLAILVIVVGFGILNTILMSVLERKRELGVMLALGLRPRSIFTVVYLESLLLATIGLVIGLLLAVPLVMWFEGNPISLSGGESEEAMAMFGFEPEITWLLKPLNPIGSIVTILGVAIVAALYPALKASRARPVEALRSL